MPFVQVLNHTPSTIVLAPLRKDRMSYVYEKCAPNHPNSYLFRIFLWKNNYLPVDPWTPNMSKNLIPFNPPSYWLVLLMRRGPQKGSKFCDLLETLKFLNMFRRNAKNVYQLYHSSLHFDTKKIYRYLRYCMKADLLEIDHIEENKFLPAKYYRLTTKGKDFLALFNDSSKKTVASKQHSA